MIVLGHQIQYFHSPPVRVDPTNPFVEALSSPISFPLGKMGRVAVYQFHNHPIWRWYSRSTHTIRPDLHKLFTRGDPNAETKLASYVLQAIRSSPSWAGDIYVQQRGDNEISVHCTEEAFCEYTPLPNPPWDSILIEMVGEMVAALGFTEDEIKGAVTTEVKEKIRLVRKTDWQILLED